MASEKVSTSNDTFDLEECLERIGDAISRFSVADSVPAVALATVALTRRAGMPRELFLEFITDAWDEMGESEWRDIVRLMNIQGIRLSTQWVEELLAEIRKTGGAKS